MEDSKLFNASQSPHLQTPSKALLGLDVSQNSQSHHLAVDDIMDSHDLVFEDTDDGSDNQYLQGNNNMSLSMGDQHSAIMGRSLNDNDNHRQTNNTDLSNTKDHSRRRRSSVTTAILDTFRKFGGGGGSKNNTTNATTVARGRKQRERQQQQQQQAQAQHGDYDWSAHASTIPTPSNSNSKATTTVAVPDQEQAEAQDPHQLPLPSRQDLAEEKDDALDDGRLQLPKNNNSRPTSHNKSNTGSNNRLQNSLNDSSLDISGFSFGNDSSALHGKAIGNQNGTKLSTSPSASSSSGQPKRKSSVMQFFNALARGGSSPSKSSRSRLGGKKGHKQAAAAASTNVKSRGVTVTAGKDKSSSTPSSRNGPLNGPLSQLVEMETSGSDRKSSDRRP